MKSWIIQYKWMIFLVFVLLGFVDLGYSQTAWFADGYHGGIYGHYPLWHTEFMVKELEKNPDWKINLEIEPETWDSVRHHTPGQYRLFQDYFKENKDSGKIEFVNPAYGQPYLYNISGESMIRHFKYGIEKISQHFPEATFTTYSSEEPCFTSSLPRILKGFGFNYAVFRNPNTCWGGYTSGYGKDLVNWIAPDGTSILTVPRYACESLEEGSTWQTESWNNSVDFVEKCFSEGVEFPVGMCFQDVNWDGGPWLESAVKDHFKPSEYVLWRDYIEMIREDVPVTDWEVSQEDIKPGLVWGASVLQKLAQGVRFAENNLAMAEKMAAFNYLHSGEPWSAESFDEAWRQLMLAQHHDCWIVPYNKKHGTTWADWADRWTDSSDEIAFQQMESTFDNIFSGSLNDDSSIVVFNSLGHERTGVAKIELPDGVSSSAGVVNSEGDSLKSQLSVLPDNQKVLYFEATVPGLGYSTFHLTGKETSGSDIDVLESENGEMVVKTDFYSATIDPRKGGTITDLVARNQGERQLVEEGKGLNNISGFFYNRNKFLSGSDSKARVSVMEHGELLVRVKVENQLAGNNYDQVITFYKNKPLIDFRLDINWDKSPGIGAYDQSETYQNDDPAKAFYNDEYKLHVQFPIKNAGGKLYKDAPFDVTESHLENTLFNRWDSLKHNVILNWVDVADKKNERGVALFSDHTTSYLQTEQLPLGLTVQYVGKGLWGKDYKIHGPTRIRYALLPHQGDWKQANIQVENASWNQPLKGSYGKGGPLQDERSLLEVSDKNIEVSSVTMDEKDLFVRFFNTSDTTKNFDVNWYFPVEKMEKVDLNHHTLDEVKKVSEDKENITKSSFTFSPFEIRTIKVTM